MTEIDQAMSLFTQGFSCSQSILAAFSDRYGLERNQTLRVAAAFGGGITRTGGLCGAASGGLMVLGLHFGSIDPQDKETKERLYLLGQAFLSEFQSRFGDVECKHLLGMDISIPQNLQHAREQGLFSMICPRVVSGTAEILQTLLKT